MLPALVFSGVWSSRHWLPGYPPETRPSGIPYFLTIIFTGGNRTQHKPPLVACPLPWRHDNMTGRVTTLAFCCVVRDRRPAWSPAAVPWRWREGEGEECGEIGREGEVERWREGRGVNRKGERGGEGERGDSSRRLLNVAVLNFTHSGAVQLRWNSDGPRRSESLLPRRAALRKRSTFKW